MNRVLHLASLELLGKRATFPPQRSAPSLNVRDIVRVISYKLIASSMEKGGSFHYSSGASKNVMSLHPL